ncbi:hypothetical protein LGM42_08385 [Burkholderia sp. AU39826]|uniref:hypothetical protein n=1 Tax=Burkholderia sp. AU39826 TaxID=2879634 RepID=UPI001CF3E293|nr:hypothetical protein [Burkholderia sp. AU39826]MCA7969903.1 hypothetical protein [Burkholderia sp. AU39826]
MTPDPPTFALIGLGLAIVPMVAVGFHWLAIEDWPARRHTPVTPPPTHSATTQRTAVDEFDE